MSGRIKGPWQTGHSVSGSALKFWIFSKRWPHWVQRYSYMGKELHPSDRKTTMPIVPGGAAIPRKCRPVATRWIISRSLLDGNRDRGYFVFPFEGDLALSAAQVGDGVLQILNHGGWFAHVHLDLAKVG